MRPEGKSSNSSINPVAKAAVVQKRLEVLRQDLRCARLRPRIRIRLKQPAGQQTKSKHRAPSGQQNESTHERDGRQCWYISTDGNTYECTSMSTMIGRRYPYPYSTLLDFNSVGQLYRTLANLWLALITHTLSLSLQSLASPSPPTSG